MAVRTMLAFLGALAVVTLSACASVEPSVPSLSPIPSSTPTPTAVAVEPTPSVVLDGDCSNVLTVQQLDDAANLDVTFRADDFVQAWQPLAVGARGGIECAWDPSVWPTTDQFNLVKISVFPVAGVPGSVDLADGVSCPNNWCDFALSTNGYWAAGSLLFTPSDGETASPEPVITASAAEAVLERVRANLDAAEPAEPFVELEGTWPSWTWNECETIVKGSGVLKKLGSGLIPGETASGGEFRAPGVLESIDLIGSCRFYAGDDVAGLTISAIPGGVRNFDLVASLGGVTSRQVPGLDDVFVADGDDYSTIYGFSGVNAFVVQVEKQDVDRLLVQLLALVDAFDAAD